MLKRLLARPHIGITAARLWGGLGSIPATRPDTLRWVLAIKSNVVLGLLAILLVALCLPGAPTENILYLALLGIGYLGLVVIARFVLNRNRSERAVQILSETLTPVEVTISTLAIYFTGGALTPMFLVYTLGIIMSIILLSPAGVYKVAFLSILQYCALTILEAYQVVPKRPAVWAGQELYAASSFVHYAAHMLVVCSALISVAYMGNRIARLIGQRNNSIESKVHDLRAVYSISQRLNNMMSDSELVRHLAATLTTLNDPDLCVLVVNSTDARAEVAAGAGLSPAQCADLRANGSEMILEVWNAARSPDTTPSTPAILDDLQLYPHIQGIPIYRGLRSLYVFPITTEEQTLGWIMLGFVKPRSLNDDYCDLMRSVANQAGVAIERARLFRDLRRLANEMSTLYDVGLHTGSTLSRSEVIRRTAGNMEKLLAPDMYYIALYDEESNTISFEHFKEHGQMMPRMKLAMTPEGSGLTGRIIRTRQPILVQDWLTDGQPYNNVAHKTGSDMLSYLGVPMVFDERVMGVLSVQCAHPSAFDGESRRLLEAMAAQTAMALENARLHSVAQEGATLDSLTKALNHGRFVEVVNEAITEAERKGGPVALIMLDIDFFKQYNDTFGHVAGDNVLVAVAEAIKLSVREEDSVGRWGGEEFGVLLPGCDLEEAKRVARRIRREIADCAPRDGHGKPITSPTVSQGISVFPEPSASPAALIEDADAALYFAKEHGRNQLVVYDSPTGKRDYTTSTLAHRLEPREATSTTGNLARHESVASV